MLEKLPPKTISLLLKRVLVNFLLCEGIEPATANALSYTVDLTVWQY